jgi:hypothetical protein
VVGWLGHFLDEHVRAGDAVAAAVNTRFFQAAPCYDDRQRRCVTRVSALILICWRLVYVRTSLLRAPCFFSASAVLPSHAFP